MLPASGKTSYEKDEQRSTTKKWLARFLLAYHTTPHATKEMKPDELFLRWLSTS